MERGSGVLLHITSLPSPFGVGDLGPGAYQFVDFMAGARLKYWQMLPLNPTEHSPYSCFSAFAGNELLLSPELLLRNGVLTAADLEPMPSFSPDAVDYKVAAEYHDLLVDRACKRFREVLNRDEFDAFCAKHAFWLDDYVLYIVAKNKFDKKAWNEWDPGIRDRKPDALDALRSKLAPEIEHQKIAQFSFFTQWKLLKEYANSKGIKLVGDIPIYVSHDSSDVWANQHLFRLNEEKRPEAVAGVPPDYFCEDGQLWGNPLYRWDVLQQNGFDWWVQRLRHMFEMFDIVRIDHFRGFVNYWEVPISAKTAREGKWSYVPTADFFDKLHHELGKLSIIAEDLGTITDDVHQVIRKLEFPGMKVLQFAFGDNVATNPYVPHNYIRNCVAYTGTHDNNTTRGWFEHETNERMREQLFKYLGCKPPIEELTWSLIRLVFMSVADVVVIPMQDYLGLGQDARMNVPGTINGNWLWRLRQEQVTSQISDRIREMAELYGRA